jgi:NADH-quinone oxidoreductase subunit A
MFYFLDFLAIYIYFLIIFCFVVLLLLISVFFDLVFFRKGFFDFEKISSYECGFQPFSDARNTFDIRFYLVAILFIIFDLELMFLLP